MKDLKKEIKPDKYTRIELAFFVVFFFLFPVLTDIEYSLNEAPCQQCDHSFLNNMIQRLVFASLQWVPYWLLYRFILHGLLLRKKYLAFVIAFIAFLFILDLYTVYLVYWPISKMGFLPGSISTDAGKWFHIKQWFHFSIIYVINQALVFTALAYFIRYAKQEEKINRLTQAKLQTDLNYLKAQLQPHFFFNTLNNIYSLAQQQSTATAPALARLADMMRYIIYETTSTKVLLEKEVEFLKNYVAVESLRYGPGISINFDTQGIDSHTLIEPLLLLPFVENVFKHGLEQETKKGFAEILICYADGKLTLETRNTKPFNTKYTTSEKGIGMGNVRKRLDLLYPNKHRLVVNEDENKYEMLLNLTLN